MTDHFEFNFGKSTSAGTNTAFDNVIDFPRFPRRESIKPSVFVLSEEYRVRDDSAVENG